MTNKNTITNLSLINKLGIDDKTAVTINSLSLEDLIALKLDLSSKNLNNRLYGFDIWRRIPYIVKESLLKYSISAAKTKKDGARMLGLTYVEYMKHIRDYDINDYYKGEQNA
tara:strand:- start:203 stop:538 length:336 start_codon:yes stop_codon:yes gene_type:complete